MIRHFSFLLLLVALGAAIVAAQSTQQEDPSSDPSVQSDPQSRAPAYQGRQSKGEQIIQGTIQKVDTIGNNVTIQTENNQQATLSLDANTSIKVNGKTATVADLKAGQQATLWRDKRP